MNIKEDAKSLAAEANRVIIEALRQGKLTVSELVQITGLGERRVRRSLTRLQGAGKTAKDGACFVFVEHIPPGDNIPAVAASAQERITRQLERTLEALKQSVYELDIGFYDRLDKHLSDERTPRGEQILEWSHHLIRLRGEAWSDTHKARQRLEEVKAEADEWEAATAEWASTIVASKCELEDLRRTYATLESQKRQLEANVRGIISYRDKALTRLDDAEQKSKERIAEERKQVEELREIFKRVDKAMVQDVITAMATGNMDYFKKTLLNMIETMG